jgi:hypothetical protein
MRRLIALAAMTAAAALLGAAPALASAGKGELFLNGHVVGTTVTPAAVPHGGIDPLYEVTNGVSGQLGIAAVGPGTRGYHGGRWAVSTVTFGQGVAPFLLTSAAAVQAAAAPRTRAPTSAAPSPGPSSATGHQIAVFLSSSMGLHSLSGSASARARIIRPIRRGTRRSRRSRRLGERR